MVAAATKQTSGIKALDSPEEYGDNNVDDDPEDHDEDDEDDEDDEEDGEEGDAAETDEQDDTVAKSGDQRRKSNRSAKVVALASTPIFKRPDKPSDRNGSRVTQQKQIEHAWAQGPRIDRQHYEYVTEDYTRRQGAVDHLRERMANKSRPGYQLRVQRKWTCASVAGLLLRRHFGWMPCIVATMADAAWDGDILQVHGLIIQRVDVNSRDKHGQLVLNICIQQQHEPITRLLLDRGAKVNAQDDVTLMTPLNNSIIMGNKALTRRLLKRGADVNLADSQGFTPLLWASMRGYLEIVAQLLELGAKVDHQDLKGWTALHIACFKGYVDLVEYLLVNGHAQLNVEDLNGFTPFLYARIAENHDITSKLDEYVAALAQGKRFKAWDKRKKKKTRTPVSAKQLYASSAN